MLVFKEIAVLDRNASFLGVPTVTLMENAGSAVTKAIVEHHKNNLKSVAIFCGLGNNGGDGLVAARHFSYVPECSVCVYLLGKPSEIKSSIAYEQYNRLPKTVEVITLESKNYRSIKEIDLSSYTAVIDSMLGVGISGKLKEPYKSIVGLMNNLKLMKSKLHGKKQTSHKGSKQAPKLGKPTIFSVDVPTGLGTDVVVTPDITVTFHDSKIGMSSTNSGKIMIRDIGIPKDAELYVGPGDLTFLPKLKPESHKGDHGKLLIIGGGPYTGAPALVGLSALRTGVDLVHIATPGNVSNTIASFSPNFIVHPLLQNSNNLTPLDVEQVLSLMNEMSVDAVVLGPGLGRSEETLNAINIIIKKLPKRVPIVLDADALTALAKLNPVEHLEGHTGVLTPHKGEIIKLLRVVEKIKIPKKGTIKNFNELQESVKQFAELLFPDWSIISKGPIDIITDGKNLKLNRTGNAGMTVGGTGDVLAGITGALLALGMQPFNAARCAAFINGYSGELAWEKFRNGLTATDIIELIPKCLIDNLE